MTLGILAMRIQLNAEFDKMYFPLYGKYIFTLKLNVLKCMYYYTINNPFSFMKIAIKDIGFRHLILKGLNDFEDGLDRVKQLSVAGVTYICGAYETVNKQGNIDLHAHFLVHSEYEERYTKVILKQENLKIPFRYPKQSRKTAKLPEQEDIEKVISYVLKNGEAYDYNDNQQYYVINDYAEKLKEAVEQHEVVKKAKAKTATQKLIEYFEEHWTDFKLHDVPQGFSQYKRIIHRECCNYAKKYWKLIDSLVIRKMTTTVLLHNEDTSKKLEQKLWELNEFSL